MIVITIVLLRIPMCFTKSRAFFFFFLLEMLQYIFFLIPKQYHPAIVTPNKFPLALTHIVLKDANQL